MPGRLEGKVALITGAARGMGRSHAVRFAQEGADIIAVDIAAPVAGAMAPTGTPEDLAETASAIEALDRRVVTRQVDVRDEGALDAAVADGVQELGRLDIAIANAGIGGTAVGIADDTAANFQVVVDINLVGVFNTAKAAVPHIRAHGEGGSLILISSALGLRGLATVQGYVAAKHGVVGLMRCLALELGPESIRVNSVHPTNVSTPLIHNEAAYRLFRPDLEDPGRDDVVAPFQDLNLLPIPWMETQDVTEAVLYLAGESGRYVTGTTMTIDAGWNVK